MGRSTAVLAKHGYQPVRTVGEGSFGKAILVRKQGERDAVVKMVDVSKATRKEREDALQESKVLSSLRHPFVVGYRENFLEDGWLCIAMDYCEGGDLSSRIKKYRKDGRTFSEDKVLRWFTQGVLALKYIHGLHVLHRDLKSGNFFLSREDDMKLGDFGIAKVLDCTVACARTQIGTPYFMAPEICEGKKYSWTADIWAMGCILYEMCATRVPFDATDLKSLIQKITKGPVPGLPSGFSKELEAIFKQMLRRNPDDRPQAENILNMPLVRDLAEAIMEQEAPVSEGNRRDSNVDVRSARRESNADPRSARSHHSDGDADAVQKAPQAPYADTAGTFSKGDKVEFWSDTHKEWLPATVKDVDADGRVIVDLKPKTWLTVEVQSLRLRPKQSSSNVSTPEAENIPALKVKPAANTPRDGRPPLNALPGEQLSQDRKPLSRQPSRDPIVFNRPASKEGTPVSRQSSNEKAPLSRQSSQERLSANRQPSQEGRRLSRQPSQEGRPLSRQSSQEGRRFAGAGLPSQPNSARGTPTPLKGRPSPTSSKPSPNKPGPKPPVAPCQGVVRQRSYAPPCITSR